MTRQQTIPLGLALLLVASGALTGCGGSVEDSKRTPSASRSMSGEAPLTSLRSVARRLAVSNGEPAAQDRNAVLTNEAVAQRLLNGAGARGDERRPVYMIWMYGNFGPEGAARPVGHLLVGIVDAKTVEVIESAVIPGELNPSMPNPERLGLPAIPLSGDITAPPPDDGTLDRLRQLARGQARSQGEADPAGEYYATNAQDAALVQGGYSANADEAVYLVALRGRFEYRGPGLFGVPPPSATPLLLLTVSADSLEVSTIAQARDLPDTRRLGEPRPLLPP